MKKFMLLLMLGCTDPTGPVLRCQPVEFVGPDSTFVADVCFSVDT